MILISRDLSSGAQRLGLSLCYDYLSLLHIVHNSTASSSSRTGTCFVALLNAALPHQLIETVSMCKTYTYAVGLITQDNINWPGFHCGFFFTGVLVCGFFGTAGGIFGMRGGTGGWGGTGARDGPPGMPFVALLGRSTCSGSRRLAQSPQVLCFLGRCSSYRTYS